jgi:hypothetical protein
LQHIAEGRSRRAVRAAFAVILKSFAATAE